MLLLLAMICFFFLLQARAHRICGRRGGARGKGECHIEEGTTGNTHTQETETPTTGQQVCMDRAVERLQHRANVWSAPAGQRQRGGQARSLSIALPPVFTASNPTVSLWVK
jgi:hypothetical protein